MMSSIQESFALTESSSSHVQAWATFKMEMEGQKVTMKRVKIYGNMCAYQTKIIQLVNEFCSTYPKESSKWTLRVSPL